MTGRDPWWSAEVRTFPRRPLRRIALLRLDRDHWRAVVAGADNQLLPGFQPSEIYSDMMALLRVARGLHAQTGLPLDLAEPLFLPRPRGPGGGERVAA